MFGCRLPGTQSSKSQRTWIWKELKIVTLFRRIFVLYSSLLKNTFSSLSLSNDFQESKVKSFGRNKMCDICITMQSTSRKIFHPFLTVCMNNVIFDFEKKRRISFLYTSPNKSETRDGHIFMDVFLAFQRNA